MLDAMEEPGLRWHHRYAIARSVLSDKPHTVLRILQQCGYVPRSQEMP